MAVNRQNTKSLETPYSGPYKDKKEEKYFIIETLAGDEQSVPMKRSKQPIFTHVHDRNKKKKKNRAQLIKTLQKTHHLQYLQHSKTHHGNKLSHAQADVFVLVDITTTSTLPRQLGL